MRQVADMALVVAHLQGAKVAETSKIFTLRVQGFYREIDTFCHQVGNAGIGPCAIGIRSWQDKYNTWQYQYLKQIEWD